MQFTISVVHLMHQKSYVTDLKKKKKKKKKMHLFMLFVENQDEI